MIIKQTKVIDKKITDAIFSFYLKKDKRLKRFKIIFPVLSLLGIVFNGVSIYFSAVDYTTILILFFSIFFLLYPFVIYPAVLKANYKKAAKLTEGKESTIELTDDSIKMILENETSEFSWSAIVSVTDIGDYITLNANNVRNLILEKNKLTEEEIQWILSYKERIL